MPVTYKKIASVTVGAGGASTIDFSSVPSNYTDIVLLVSARTTASVINANARVQFNNNTSSIYSNRYLYNVVVSSSAGSSSETTTWFNMQVNGNNATTSTFGNAVMYITNYASTTTNKSASTDAVTENNAADAAQVMVAQLFASTSAISSIKLTPDSGNFAQYSTATLYGISKS